MPRALKAFLTLLLLIAIGAGIAAAYIARASRDTTDYVAAYKALVARHLPQASAAMPADGSAAPLNVVIDSNSFFRAVDTRLNQLREEQEPRFRSHLYSFDKLLDEQPVDPEIAAAAEFGLAVLEADGIFHTARLVTALSPAPRSPGPSGMLLAGGRGAIAEVGPLLAEAMILRMRRQFDAGSTEEALQSARLAMAIANLRWAGMTWLDFLSAARIARLTGDSLQRAAIAGRLSDAALAESLTIMSPVATWPPQADFVEGDRLIALNALQQGGRTLDRFRYREPLDQCYQYLSVLMSASPIARASDPVAVEAAAEVDSILSSDFQYFALAPFPPARHLAVRDRAYTDLRATALVLLLERYRKATGAYPATLDEIASDPSAWHKTLPDGWPLLYRRTESAYQLYSTGADGADDGGVPHPKGNDYAFGRGNPGADAVYR